MPGPTVKVDRYVELSETGGESGPAYKGLPILATRGTHEFAASTLSRAVATGESVLELGAGTGAFSLRLADAGYRVTAVDFVAANFRARHPRIRFLCCDLNEDLPIAADAGYGAVTAVEIIEHLENPRHFLRSAFGALKPGGTLVLTTPNINNPKSLATFIWSGRFASFLERDYQGSGHISPLPWFVLRDALHETGFENVVVSSFKSGLRSLKGVLGWTVQALGWANRGPKGQKLVALATKPVPS